MKFNTRIIRKLVEIEAFDLGTFTAKNMIAVFNYV